MSLFTLVFHNNQNPDDVITKIISWEDLFGQKREIKEVLSVNDQKVEIRYINNILVIITSDDVDVIYNRERPSPLMGLYINTAGYLEIFGLPMSLDYGLWAIAYDIQLDAEVESPTFVRLDELETLLGGVKGLNGSVQINKKIETNNLIVNATEFNINAHVVSNSAELQYKSLTIEALGGLLVGKKSIIFEERTAKSNSFALKAWNGINKSPVNKTNLNDDIIYLNGETITQNGTLKLNNAEIINKDDITYGISSKTTYDYVNIFSKGGMQSHEKSIIDGNNVYFGFENDLNFDGECKIDNLTITGQDLTVSGLLWGGEQLNTKFTGLIVNNGLIGSNKTNGTANAILTSSIKNDKNIIWGGFTKGGIVGTQSLSLNAIGIMIVGGGYIKAPNIQYRTGIFVNLAGIVSAYNVVERSIFFIDLGLNLPCSPNSFYDLANADKLLRLSCRVLGNSFPMLRNAATLGSLAAPLGSMIKHGAFTTAEGVSNAATGLYYNPKKQAARAVDAASSVKDSVFAAPIAVSNTLKTGVNSVSSAVGDVYNAGLVNKAKDSMSKISESWDKTRWLDLLNYLLTLQDWYIGADMIMTRGTNVLVFANDVKNCIKVPQKTIDGIANNISVMMNDIASSIADPNLATNISHAATAELKKAAAVPLKAINKISSQANDAVNTIVNPIESINKLSSSAANVFNSVTIENAKKNTLDPINKKKEKLLEASNNLFFGENHTATVATPNCEAPQLESSNDLCSEEGQTVETVIPSCDAPQMESTTVLPEDAQTETVVELSSEEPQLNDKPAPVKKKSSTIRDTIFDMGLILAPSIDRRTAVSMNFGIVITGSEMEDTLFSSHNGVSIALASSNYSLFGYHNSGGIYSNTRNEVVGHRYNTGDVHVNSMNLSATNNEEHGDFQYSEFIFDIKRNFNTSSATKMPGSGVFSGKIGGNFYGGSDFEFSHGNVDIGGTYTVAQGVNHVVTGDAQLHAKNAEVHGNFTMEEDSTVHFDKGVVYKGGKFRNEKTTYTGDTLTFMPGSKVELIDDLIKVNTLDDQGAEVYTKNHITIAKILNRGGNWNYSGFLHEQIDELHEATNSKLEKLNNEVTYSLKAIRADINGSGKHSYVQASIDEMPTSEAIDYALGNGKYSGIEVTESIYVTTKSEEGGEYIGTRPNGARAQIQTNGRITLPSQFERARGMTFASYEEAEQFVRYVYPTYKLPPPEPKKRHGFKKYLARISKELGTISSLFAKGGDPITAAIAATAAGLAYTTDKVDKHYGRKENKDLEKRELERAELQHRLDNEGLVSQERSVLSNLVNQDHINRVENAAQQHLNQNSAIDTLAASNVRSLDDSRQEVLQNFAVAREELANQNQKQLADISYHHARQRDDLARIGGPVIGGGVAIQGGSSGVTTFVTITAGNRGETVTGRIPIANHDFNSPRAINTQGSEVPRVSDTRIEDVTYAHDETERVSAIEVARVGAAIEDRFLGTGPARTQMQILDVTMLDDDERLALVSTSRNNNDISRPSRTSNNVVIGPQPNQFAKKSLAQVLFAAIDGNISAKMEMRKRANILAKFFDSIDPELKPKKSDSAVMAELKMYARSAKDVRDQFIHLVKHPHELVTGPFTLGADVIEAGLYHYFGKEYYVPARERNYSRMQAVDQLIHADGLTQRQVILTAGLNAIIGKIAMVPRGPIVATPPSRAIVPAFKYVSKQQSLKHNFVNESELLKHFKKHGGEFKGSYRTPEEYLHGANFVINHGHKVKYIYDGEMRVGYVRFMSNTRRGEAKFEFLALRNDGSIATYHTQRGENFYKTLNQNKANDSINVEHLSCRMM